MKIRIFFFTFILTLLINANVLSKSGVPFNPVTDIDYGEIHLTFLGLCICPQPPPFSSVIGILWSYWEPYVAIDTVSTPFYSPFLGMPTGSSALYALGGTNASQDAASSANEVTFSQAHVHPIPFLNWLPLMCNRWDFPTWMTEFDPQWNFDELSMLIHPEAALYANPAMQLACQADAVATNVGYPIDSMPWCVGSGGSAYPMTGTVQNDEITQANNTAAARLIYKLNRLHMVCDPALSPCGCVSPSTWVKSHYKTHVSRPGSRRPARPFGVTSELYNSGLNVPFVGGGLGSEDEYLWTVYRRQFCCTCCD